MGWTRRLAVVVLMAVLLSACRVLGPGSQPAIESVPPTGHPPTVEAEPAPPSEPAPALDVEAPPECGFAEGTALEYAGRSTTAALDVQEVVGDPMSDNPADIYITRDPFARGELHGRLVCAIFANDPQFVEITVHPADGGRWVPPTPAPSIAEPPGGIPEAEAVAIARGAVDHGDTWTVASTTAGPLASVMSGASLENDWSAGLPDDQWAWSVFLVRDDEGVSVVVDYVEGTVLGTVSYIVN